MISKIGEAFMVIRYIILTFILTLASIVGSQSSFAHPPNLHDEATQEPIVQEQIIQEPSRLDEDKTVPQNKEDDGAKAVEHSHENGGHESSGNENSGNDEAANNNDGHSHWGLSPDSKPFAKTMAAFGKFHPLIVHFPIALFLTAAFAQILNIRSKTGAYDKTVMLLVWLGALGALGAGLLGWAHSGPVQINENTIMSSHRWIGSSLLVGGLLTAFIMNKAKSREGGMSKHVMFNVLLFAMALGVAINGFLGGALAHGGMKHLMPGIM